ncbi:MAG: hypothetical protein IPL59_14295 [Candidatus Competibacteraceae bacterium]|nr:hypothetical protein [Candidatus Competibacteraceae bacterium]
MHLHYRFTADAASDIGWQPPCPIWTPPRTNYLEFWIRGDDAPGFADALKVEFKQPLPERAAWSVAAGQRRSNRHYRRRQRIPGTAEPDERHCRLAALRQFGIDTATAPFAGGPRRVLAERYCLDQNRPTRSQYPRSADSAHVKTAWENSIGGKSCGTTANPPVWGWPERLLVTSRIACR